jgi:hypothetical protein
MSPVQDALQSAITPKANAGALYGTSSGLIQSLAGDESVQPRLALQAYIVLLSAGHRDVIPTCVPAETFDFSEVKFKLPARPCLQAVPKVASPISAGPTVLDRATRGSVVP